MTKIILPLQQHVGRPCKPIVQQGEKVKRGQLLAIPAGLGANLHASFTGKISEIAETHIAIETEQEENLTTYLPLPKNLNKLETIASAGIVGAGGAGFPTAVKLSRQLPQGVFIANGAECEALFGHNVRLMQEEAAKLVRGIKYCMEITKAPRGFIALKEKHKDQVKALQKLVAQENNLELFFLPDLYPEGDERVLVREILGIELQPGQLPGEVNAVIDNVETIKHIVEAIEDGKPFIDKDLTIAGRVAKSGLVLFNVPLGTPVELLLHKAGGLIEPSGEIILGGPMTGKTGSLTSPLLKTMGGVLVAMPFPQEKRKMGILVCECGGSEARLQQIAVAMGAEVVAQKLCKRMVKVQDRYRCDKPGVCPGQAGAVLELKKQGAQVLLVGSCSQ